MGLNPMHALLSLDDYSVYLANSWYSSANNVTVQCTVATVMGAVVSHRTLGLFDVQPDSNVMVGRITSQDTALAGEAFLVRLTTIWGNPGSPYAINDYWVSKMQDVPDWDQCHSSMPGRHGLCAAVGVTLAFSLLAPLSLLYVCSHKYSF